jgi:hypothetical protein
MSSSSHDHHDQPFGYEKKDANIKVISLVTLATALFVIVSVIVVDDVFVLTKEEIIYDTVLRPESVPLRDLRAHEDEVLHSYKVLDAAKGVYQIPIDRALQLMADEAYRTKTSPQ